MLKIAIVGAGYVGLVTAACLAELGHDLTCIDNDEARIQALCNGRVPIYEPGLDDLTSRNIARGSLRFSTDLAGAVKGCDAVFIAVGTPSREGSDHADVRHVLGAAQEIAANLDRFTAIVIKSTVPVGTNRRVQRAVEGRLPPGLQVAVVSNPEFLREGNAIDDFMRPDRIVLGTENNAAARIMQQVYAPLIEAGAVLLVAAPETAEMIKYASNAFLAVKVSYINEVADLCEQVGADIGPVALGIGLDRRIGQQFLQVGPGWGGSCFPKDTRALRATAADNAVPMRIVEAAIEANDQRKHAVVRKVESICGGSVAGKRLAVFGLTFKSGTDDLRESPSIDAIRALSGRGARVRAYDPSQPTEAIRLLPGLVMASTPVATVRNADVLIVLTDWKEFAECDLDQLAAYMADPIMIDLRNLFDEMAVRNHGFRHYVCLGRKTGEPCHSRSKSASERGGKNGHDWSGRTTNLPPAAINPEAPTENWQLA